MPNIKNLRQLTDDVLGFQRFVLSYQETTVYHMQQVRDSVVGSRSFMTGLLEVFDNVRHLQNVTHDLLGRPHPVERSFQTLAKNGQTAAVLLSFETKLTGRALHETFDLFAHYLEDHPQAQPVLVGQTGRQLYQQSELSARPSHYFPLSEKLDEAKELKPLLEYLLQFQDVNVFVPVFRTLVSQPPTMIAVTGDRELTELPQEESPAHRHITTQFLVEPSLEDLRRFFEVQIIVALLQQLTEEARLATLGSRITTLEQTYATLSKQLTTLNRQSSHARRQIQDKKQRTRLASMSLWR